MKRTIRFRIAVLAAGIVSAASAGLAAGPYLPSPAAAVPPGLAAYGLAVEEDILAPLVNPAALGVHNATGFGLLFPLNQDSIAGGGPVSGTYGLLVNLGGFSYSFTRDPAVDYHHRAALGLRFADGIYGGAAWNWTNAGFRGGDWGLSLLVRPAPFLSLALKNDGLVNSSERLDFGLGLRPLFAPPGLSHRLTLFADGVWDKAFKGWRFGFAAEPLDGVRLSAGYDYDAKMMGIGLNLALGAAGLGGVTAVDASAGRVSGGWGLLSLSFLERRTPLDGLVKYAAEYKKAGSIGDLDRRGFWLPRSGNLSGLLADLERIERDPRVSAVVFRDQRFAGSLANLLELRDALLAVKKAGKKIYFYFDAAPRGAYGLAAAAADRIVLAPGGGIDLRGFGQSGLYLRDFLADWGIEVVNYRSHDSKTAYNFLSEARMTDAERAALKSLYGDLAATYAGLLQGRGGKLKKSAAELMAAGPYLNAAEAVEAGLVDAAAYPDEFEQWLKKEHADIGLVEYSPLPEYAYEWRAPFSKPRVALVYAEGPIVSGEGPGSMMIAQESMLQTLRGLRKNPRIAGIILRVNSGGGSALVSDLIAREIELAVKEDKKPVVVSMGGAAASGGYYIAAKASRIVASPASLTGSIGVIAIHPDASGLLKKFKLNYDSEKTAGNADFFSPFRPAEPAERDKLRSGIGSMYDRFVGTVAEGRGLTKAEVEASAQGRVWTGNQARERKLVDELGGLAAAKSAMRKLLGADELRVSEVVPGPWFNTAFFSRMVLEPVEAGLPRELGAALEDLRLYGSFDPGEPLYLMPYRPEE